MRIRALVFDFDGLLVDTEGPIFAAWQRIYRERGQELPRERWLTIIGTASGPFDPLLDLGQRTGQQLEDRKSTRLNSSHSQISYAVFCLKKKNESNLRGWERTPDPRPSGSVEDRAEPCTTARKLATQKYAFARSAPRVRPAFRSHWVSPP